MRALTAILMLALLSAPVALAQENTNESTRPDDAAWVEDCPPDMMCAAGSEDPQAYGDEDCIECSGPVDEPREEGTIGPEGCVDCFQPPGETCMDGAQENETCRDDVYYLGGDEPTRGPADGSCENCRGDEAPVQAEADAQAEKAVPIPAALVILAIAAALVFVAIRK